MHELLKEHIQMTKGLAIVSMILLHLFCRKGADVYGTPLFWLNDQTPLVYYLGFLSEICVALYCLCSGYAHYRLGQKNDLTFYRNSNRLLKFLLNFWIVCLFFSLLGLMFDSTNTIPQSTLTFLENFFLLRITYNGAWWFVATYLYLVILSSFIFRVVRNYNSLLVGTLLIGQYVVIYLLFRAGIQFSGQDPITTYIATQLNNFIGTVLFTYGTGMLIAKENIISLCGAWLENKTFKYRNTLIALVTVIISLILCILEKALLMPFFAVFAFVMFNLWNKSHNLKMTFLFLGKHSTNIWLVHMFFYLTLFKNLVVVAKYPVLIFGLMMVICISVSYVIFAIYKPLLNLCMPTNNKIFLKNARE